MKISRLNKVHNYRIFRDFNWPSKLSDFSRFNLIYGWNGSGKTSLSNLFRSLQQRQPLLEGQVEILIDQMRVSGADFGTVALPAVRVFNRDTVDRNVFELANEQLPPVFFLGEDSVEKQQQIEILKKQHAAKVQAQAEREKENAEALSSLDAFCAKEAKALKNLLTAVGGGSFNNYNATHFKKSLQALTKRETLPSALTEAQRYQHLVTKDGKAMQKVVEPAIHFPNFSDLVERTQLILSRSVVSSVLAELVEHPKVALWVNEGLALHLGQPASNKCKFCDQVLPEQRIKRLEAHFNDEFKQFQAAIKSAISEVNSAQAGLDKFHFPPKEVLYENLRPEYEQVLETLDQSTALMRIALDLLLHALTVKRDEPFKQFELRSFIVDAELSNELRAQLEVFFQEATVQVAGANPSIGQVALAQLKAVIERHNTHTDSFDAAANAAREALAQDEVLKAQPEWLKKSKEVSATDERVAETRKEVADIEKAMTKLERQVRQHLRPAEELNYEIAAYLGRAELHFEVEQNGYHIMRNGHPATHLSEGERTALAFLYFLKSLQGTDFDLQTGIVVIDDPISSLDTNSLFNAFMFLKQRTAEAGQLFVLTHNFTFFKQVRNWYYSLPGQRTANGDAQPARFYMLAAKFANGSRTAELQALAPLLHHYESEYHYLFKRIYEEANKPAVQNLEIYYTLSNMARRLLESFLAFRVPNKPGKLSQKLDAIGCDALKKARILQFLYTYSHFDQVSEPDYDLSVLAKTPAILQEILALIQTSDAEHFKCMSELMALPL